MLVPMRFTEHELTAALHGAAKTVLAAQSKDVRKGRADIDTVWEGLSRYQRFTLLDSLGDQILPVLIALPDVPVEAGTRPTFTDAEITEAVESRMGDGEGRLRRKVLVAARVALVRTALSHVPPRTDPDALIVPDHL
jgi:hypothetical protein